MTAAVTETAGRSNDVFRDHRRLVCVVDRIRGRHIVERRDADTTPPADAGRPPQRKSSLRDSAAIVPLRAGC